MKKNQSWWRWFEKENRKEMKEENWMNLIQSTENEHQSMIPLQMTFHWEEWDYCYQCWMILFLQMTTIQIEWFAIHSIHSMIEKKRIWNSSIQIQAIEDLPDHLALSIHSLQRIHHCIQSISTANNCEFSTTHHSSHFHPFWNSYHQSPLFPIHSIHGAPILALYQSNPHQSPLSEEKEAIPKQMNDIQ